MKNLITILLMLFTLTAYSQTAPLNLAVKFQISLPGSTGTYPNFMVSGFTNDDMGRWNAADVQVGDSLYVLNGGQDLVPCYISNINSAAGTSLDITVVCAVPGTASLNSGQAAIIRPTGTNKLPTYISGLNDALRSLIMNRFSQIVDNINIDITSYIGISGVAPAVAASSYSGEVWKNSVGELYKSNGTVWSQVGQAYTAGSGVTLATSQFTNDLITGKSGGQIITSDINAGGDLVIQGTSHPTTTGSTIILQPVGGNVGINTSDPRAALSVQGSIFSGQYNLAQNNADRATGLTTGFANGRTNKLFSWDGIASGTSNWVDGKITSAFGNVNIASGNDGVAAGNRTVIGRKQYNLEYIPGFTDQGADTGHGVTAIAGQTRAFVVVHPSEGDVRGYFPSAQMFVTDPSLVNTIYGAGATVDALGNVYSSSHSAPGDLTWALHPFMILRDSTTEIGIREFRILNATYNAVTGTRIYYDTTASVYPTISWIYSSAAPTVRIYNIPLGNGQFSSGVLTSAASYAAASFGLDTKAWGEQSFAGGLSSRALGQASFAFGINARANSFGSISLGAYPVISGTTNSVNNADHIFAIGNGTGPSTRATTMYIQRDGLSSFANNLGVGGAPVNRFSVTRGIYTLTVEPDANSLGRTLMRSYNNSTGVATNIHMQTGYLNVGRLITTTADTTVKLNVQGSIWAFDPVKASTFKFGETINVTSGYDVRLGQDDAGMYTINNSSGRGFYWNNNTTNRLMTISNAGRVVIGTTTTPVAKLVVESDAIGVAQSTLYGIATVNNTLAAAGAQQFSPPIRMRGNGWRTAAGGASQAVDFNMYVTPVEGTAAPTGYWQIGSSINGNAYTPNLLTVTSGGNVGISTATPAAKIDIVNSSTVTTGSVLDESINGSYAATSGNAIYRSLNMAYTINNVGTPVTGSATGIFLNASETALNGMTHNLVTLQTDGTTRININNTGGILSQYTKFGSGSPEGVVTAPVGSIYSRTDGSAGTSMYIKESGAGSAGWTAMSTSIGLQGLQSVTGIGRYTTNSMRSDSFLEVRHTDAIALQSFRMTNPTVSTGVTWDWRNRNNGILELKSSGIGAWTAKFQTNNLFVRGQVISGPAVISAAATGTDALVAGVDSLAGASSIAAINTMPNAAADAVVKAITQTSGGDAKFVMYHGNSALGYFGGDASDGNKVKMGTGGIPGTNTHLTLESYGTYFNRALYYNVVGSSGTTYQIPGTESIYWVTGSTTTITLPEIVASSPGANQVTTGYQLRLANPTGSSVTINRSGSDLIWSLTTITLLTEAEVVLTAIGPNLWSTK